MTIAGLFCRNLAQGCFERTKKVPVSGIGCPIVDTQLLQVVDQQHSLSHT